MSRCFRSIARARFAEAWRRWLLLVEHFWVAGKLLEA